MTALWHWFLNVTGSQIPPSGSQWYNWWSGPGSDLGELTIVGGMVAVYRKHNCHSPWCWRLGHHTLADGTPICRKHHPDLPNRKRTLAELHAAHHDAVSAGSSPLAKP